MTFTVHAEGASTESNWQIQGLRVKGTDFLETYGMTLVAGRPFSADRALDSTRAVIVNEQLVETVGGAHRRRLWASAWTWREKSRMGS